MDIVPDLLPNGKPNPMKGRVASRGETPASAGNVANIVTVARILLAPVFIWMLIADDGAGGLFRWLAAGLFVLAILTDAVDGFHRSIILAPPARS